MPAMKIASIVAELKSERDRLDQAIQALSGVSNQRKSGKRKLSADARARIAQAQEMAEVQGCEEGLMGKVAVSPPQA